MRANLEGAVNSLEVAVEAITVADHIAIIVIGHNVQKLERCMLAPLLVYIKNPADQELATSEGT